MPRDTVHQQKKKKKWLRCKPQREIYQTENTFNEVGNVFDGFFVAGQIYKIG